MSALNISILLGNFKTASAKASVAATKLPKHLKTGRMTFLNELVGMLLHLYRSFSITTHLRLPFFDQAALQNCHQCFNNLLLGQLLQNNRMLVSCNCRSMLGSHKSQCPTNLTQNHRFALISLQAITDIQRKTKVRADFCQPPAHLLPKYCSIRQTFGAERANRSALPPYAL